MSLTQQELAAIERANATAVRPVVFIHGLWLLSSSWDRWCEVFEDAGFTALAPGWPDDPATVEAARADPTVFAGKIVGTVTDHYLMAVAALETKPVIIGHSFGGLIAQKIASKGAAAATVAIDPAPGRGILPVPASALKAGSPVVGNPLNYHRAVTLSPDEFKYGWANTLSDDEAKSLYDEFHVAASGSPIFQAVAANFNPWSETKVKFKATERGPLLIIAGEQDHTVPPVVNRAAYKKHRKNAAITEYVEMPGRGHALTIDHGWREVAEAALSFVRRFAPAHAAGDTPDVA